MMEQEVIIPEELFVISNDVFGKGWTTNKVVIRRFEFGDTLKLQKDSLKIQGMLGSTPTAELNSESWQVVMILIGVKTAPWGAGDVSAIKKLPPMIGQWVMEEIQAFNTLEVKKKPSSNSSPGA